MSDQWTDRLSEYVDGELGTPERQALEVHLSECRDCVATLAELRAVVARAQTLDNRPPENDLWPRIESRLTGATPARKVVGLWPTRPAEAGRRISFSLPQLAAASVLLAIVSGGSVWLLRSRIAAPPSAPILSESQPAEDSAGAVPQIKLANFADSQFDAAVADLERALAEGRGRLDLRTIEILDKNLTIIDRAIHEARQALASDPANTYLNSHLVEARRRKLELLREAMALADRSS